MICAYAVVILASLAVLLPFAWMIASSFKSQRDLYAYPPTFLPAVWKFSNYTRAATTGAVTFDRMFLNTMCVAVPTTVLNLAFSALAAYGFARLQFRGRGFFFSLFIASMMVPSAVVLIPQFLMFNALGLTNTYWPLIMPSMFGTAFSIFLLRQFFMTIPVDLEEAAIIDGCGRLRICATIFVPLSKAIIATLTVFTFQRAYNDFMNPLIYLNSAKLFTIQLGLASFRNAYSARYDLIMAGSVMALVPIVVLFAFCQKYIVKGIVMTGIKG
jgi:multiple sugar transport system permease protein